MFFSLYKSEAIVDNINQPLIAKICEKSANKIGFAAFSWLKKYYFSDKNNCLLKTAV